MSYVYGVSGFICVVARNSTGKIYWPPSPVYNSSSSTSSISRQQTVQKLQWPSQLKPRCTTIRLLSIREWNGNRLPYGLLRDSDNLSSEHFAHPFTALLRSPSDLSHCPLADQLCRNVVVEQEASPLLAPTSSSEEGRHVPADGSESISCFITTPLMVLGTVAAVSVSFEMHYQNICASFWTSTNSLRDLCCRWFQTN